MSPRITYICFSLQFVLIMNQLTFLQLSFRMLMVFVQAFFYKPNLWWPNGMGKQSLYNVEISVEVKGFGESDSWSHPFGFRKIESDIDSATGGRYVTLQIDYVWLRLF